MRRRKERGWRWTTTIKQLACAQGSRRFDGVHEGFHFDDVDQLTQREASGKFSLTLSTSCDLMKKNTVSYNLRSARFTDRNTLQQIGKHFDAASGLTARAVRSLPWYGTSVSKSSSRIYHNNNNKEGREER